jgi:uncharacterized protein (TIGR04255 family)
VIPNKLKDDAIVEAVCQLRFSTSEIGEVVVGRLSDFPEANTYRQERLPASDVPGSLRSADPEFKFQPLLQLSGQGGKLVRIGEQVLSTHAVGVSAYPGWSVFKPRLATVFSQLFDSKMRDVRVENVTLRYINAMTKERHFIAAPNNLRLAVTVADATFSGPVNLNFFETPTKEHVITTRIADVHFVQGQLPQGTTAIVDVEVSTRQGFVARNLDDVMAWIETAHDLEKAAFFKLLPVDVVQKLKED